MTHGRVCLWVWEAGRGRPGQVRKVPMPPLGPPLPLYFACVEDVFKIRDGDSCSYSKLTKGSINSVSVSIEIMFFVNNAEFLYILILCVGFIFVGVFFR